MKKKGKKKTLRRELCLATRRLPVSLGFGPTTAVPRKVCLGAEEIVDNVSRMNRMSSLIGSKLAIIS